MQEIDWEQHSQALNKMVPHQKIMIQKLIHDWLPVNSRLSRQDHAVTPGCSHFVQCTGIVRSKSPNRLWQSLQAIMKVKEMDQRLQQLLKPWLYQECMSEEAFEAAGVPWEYRDLATHQGQLGWNQVYNGQMVWMWATLQERYYSKVKRKEFMNGDRWVQAVIQVQGIWRWVHAEWKMRCNARHEEGEDNVNGRQACAKLRIKVLYNKRQALEEEDHRIFQIKEEELVTKPIKQQEMWIAKATDFIRARRRALAQQQRHGNGDIRHYFTHGQLRRPGA